MKVRVGVLPSRYRALITRKEVSGACVCCRGFVFVFCLVCFLVVAFFCCCSCIGLISEITILNITAASIIIIIIITIISKQSRMQSCYSRRTVLHLNNHPNG